MKQQNKKTSAYFEESESSISNVDKINNGVDIQCSTLYVADRHILDFPRRADILWDRSPLTASLTIQSANIYYPLIMSTSEAKQVLSLLHCNNAGEGVDFCVDLLPRRSISNLHTSQSPYVFAMSTNSSNILRAQTIKSHNLLSQCTRANSPYTLTIPIARLTEQSVETNFPDDSSRCV